MLARAMRRIALLLLFAATLPVRAAEPDRPMTAAEFDLLYALCEHPNRVLTRDQLIGLTHGPVEGPHERSIDTLISRLRQKMETDVGSPRLIQTVRSEGYMFSAQVSRR